MKGVSIFLLRAIAGNKALNVEEIKVAINTNYNMIREVDYGK